MPRAEHLSATCESRESCPLATAKKRCRSDSIPSARLFSAKHPTSPSPHQSCLLLHPLSATRAHSPWLPFSLPILLEHTEPPVCPRSFPSCRVHFDTSGLAALVWHLPSPPFF